MNKSRTFPSKIGLELVIPIAFVLLTVLIFSFGSSPFWMGITIIGPIALLVSYVFGSTQYEIDGKQLIIKCGIFYNSKIDIQNIIRIKETNNPLSSPATSLDRLEISYEKNKSVLISPKEKSTFIEALKELNPKIEVIRKSK
jgi:Bacterial PH domain